MERPNVQTLRQFASEMWEVFVDGDPDLMVSSCSCCEAKRVLVRRMQGVTGQTSAVGSMVHKHPSTATTATADVQQPKQQSKAAESKKE